MGIRTGKSDYFIYSKRYALVKSALDTLLFKFFFLKR